MRVNGARVNQAVVFPHVAEQLVARLHAAAALRKDREQLELRRGEFNRLALPTGDMAWHINVQITEAQLIFRLLLGLAAREDFLMRNISSRGLNGLVK